MLETGTFVPLVRLLILDVYNLAFRLERCLAQTTNIKKIGGVLMKQKLTTLLSGLFLTVLSVAPLLAADGLIKVKSPHDAKKTMDRFEKVVKEKGMNIFARINHSAGAAKVNKKLRPTELLILGNPQGGTPFMECEQTVGIDLPLKALVWQDDKGQVWLGYNDPEFIAKRHGAGKCPVVGNMQTALAGFADAAVKP